MHDLPDWNRLDTAAYRVSMKRSVRRLAWYLAICGTVVAVIGFVAPFKTLLVVGVVLAAAGLWNLPRPSIGGLLVDGVAMILTGAFQCLSWLWMDDARAPSLGKAVVTGVLQILWGIRRVATYRTSRRVVNDPPAIARLEAIVREVSKLDAKSDPAVVEFRTGRFNHLRNRLGLFSEGTVGLLEQQVVRLEKRADIWIETAGTTSGGSMKVRIHMGDVERSAQMSAAHVERFEGWKLGQVQSRQIAA